MLWASWLNALNPTGNCQSNTTERNWPEKKWILLCVESFLCQHITTCLNCKNVSGATHVLKHRFTRWQFHCFVFFFFQNVLFFFAVFFCILFMTCRHSRLTRYSKAVTLVPSPDLQAYCWIWKLNLKNIFFKWKSYPSPVLTLTPHKLSSMTLKKLK